MSAPSQLFQGVFSIGFIEGDFHASQGDGANTAVTGDSQRKNGVETVSCFVFTSSQEMNRTLGLSGSGDINCQLDSVHAEFSFLQQTDMSATDVTIIAVGQQSTTTCGVNFKPAQHVEHVIGHKVMLHDLFRKQYGDSFVSDITTGSKFYAFFTLKARSSSEQRDISGKLGAGASGIGLKADIAAKMNSVISRYQATMKSNRTIIGGSGISLPQDPSQYLDFAIRFTSMPIKDSAVLSLSHKPYDVAGFTY
jgi:hypothetical protein